MCMIHLGMCFPADGEAAAPPPRNPRGQFAEKSHFLLLITTLSPPPSAFSLFLPLCHTHGLYTHIEAGIQCKPPIHKGKAEVEQHLVIPPTYCCSSGESHQLHSKQLCATYAFPKGCPCSLQRQLFAVFTVYRTQLHVTPLNPFGKLSQSTNPRLQNSLVL